MPRARCSSASFVNHTGPARDARSSVLTPDYTIGWVDPQGEILAYGTAAHPQPRMTLISDLYNALEGSAMITTNVDRFDRQVLAATTCCMALAATTTTVMAAEPSSTGSGENV